MTSDLISNSPIKNLKRFSLPPPEKAGWLLVLFHRWFNVPGLHLDPGSLSDLVPEATHISLCLIPPVELVQTLVIGDLLFLQYDLAANNKSNFSLKLPF